MAVYYKFKSARDYDSIPMDGPFISVGSLKEKIFVSKHLGRGTDFDLLVSNAQTNEEYLDEGMLIPKNTSVLIRRVPGRPCLTIVTEQEPKVETVVEATQPEMSVFQGADSSVMKYSEDTEWDEFGNDLYTIPEAPSVQANNPLPDAPPTNKADEDSKIKALIDTPALDWQRQGSDGFVPGGGRGFGRGMGGRMGGRGFGMERKTPPQGYICHRCKVPGHFIQHCPTNGDPKYDVKKFKHPTGIPKSMLTATPDGSYALPSGAVAVLRPNEAAFEREMEGLPSTRSVGDLPPGLHCPLCKEVMKDAVFASKCCFNSFCDKCIRDHIISKAVCVCGATNVLADDLLPNKTVRDTINHSLESGNSSTENAGSIFQQQGQDKESARCPQPKVPSPTMTAPSKGEQKPLPIVEQTPITKETTDEGKAVIASQPTVEKLRTASAKAPDVSEATHESMTVKEPASQGSAPLLEEEVQQGMASREAGKKKKKKKIRMPENDMMQWKSPQDIAAENCMMSLGPSAYNPYWSGMQPGMEGYMAPSWHGMQPGMPYMGYGMGPLDMPFGGMMPPDPFGAQAYMMPPVPPQRDLAEFRMGMNGPPPIMSREEFEARKADLRRKRENERRVGEREFMRDREYGREVSSGGGDGNASSMKPKPGSSADHNRHRAVRSSPEPPPRPRAVRSSPEPLPRHRTVRSSLEPPPRQPKRKSDHDRGHDYNYDYNHDRGRERDRHHHHRSESSSKPSSETTTKRSSTTAAAAAAEAAAEKKHKACVFSRISFPEQEAIDAKKRKLSSSSSATNTEAAGGSVPSSHHKGSSDGHYDDYKSSSTKGLKSSSGATDYESSDEDRHFKRKPLRRVPSPPPPAEWDDEPRHSRGSRERKHR